MSTNNLVLVPILILGVAATAVAQSLGETLQETVALRRDGNTVVASIAAQSLTFPVSSSSGGFTMIYVAGGGQGRKARTFGSLFGERALTNGRGKLSISLNYQTRSWTDIDNSSLDNDFNVIARFIAPTSSQIDDAPMQPGESENFRSKIGFRTDATVISANLGLLDYLDLGVAIPLVATSIEGNVSVSRTLLHGATAPVAPTYKDGRPTSVVISERAFGLGDIYLRPKWVVHGGDAAAYAVMGELRIPTGKVEELLGVGRYIPKLGGVASFVRGAISPHLNAFYAWGDGGIQFGQVDSRDNRLRPGCAGGLCREPNLVDGYLGVSDEFDYVVGTEVEAVPKLTLTFDLIGRVLFDAARFERVDTPGSTIDGILRTIDTELISRPATVHNALAAVGFKWQLSEYALLVGTALVPVSRQGLTSSFSATFGIETLALGRQRISSEVGNLAPRWR